MNLRPSTTLVRACSLAGLSCLALLGACHVVEPAAPQEWVFRPSWADDLDEEVETVPSKDRESPPAIAPTEFAGDPPQIPRGEPRELIQPIQREPATSSGRNKPASPPSGRDGSGVGDDDGDSVVVTINNHTAETEEEKPVTAPPPRSFLERLYQGQFEREPDRELMQFGYDFFQVADPKIDEEGPVPGNYVVGPGDEILVTVSGSFHEYHRLEVDREGNVSVPDLGSVPVAGREFRELQAVFYAAYRELHLDFEVVVGMGALRRIQVFLVGQVKRPGLAEISARGTVVSALVSGGGPLKEGSLRRVVLRRSGEEEVVLDLYHLLIDGQPNPELLLRNGDTIYVPPIGPTIGVAGYVQRPAIYEIKDTVSVDEAIGLAGGLTPFTFRPHFQLERTVDGRGRETLDIEMTETGLATAMQDGELMLVGAVDDRMQPIVRISGQVVREGDHQFRRGMRVSDLVKLADGLTVDAFLPQAFISRQVGSTGAVEVIPDREDIGSTRRVLVIDLAKAMAGDEQHDLVLHPLDQLSIRSQQQATIQPAVRILGAVRDPGTYELTHGLRVTDLIALAGNLTEDVYYDEAELIRRKYDERSRQLSVERFRFDLGKALTERGRSDPVLENGDQLVIRSLQGSSITVTIDGQVKFPGEYVFPQGARITDLIAAAGGLNEHADLRAATFNRESVAELQRERYSHLIERSRRLLDGALEKVLQTGTTQEGLAAKLAQVQTQETLGRMSSMETTGRIVIPFTRSDFPTSPHNLTLEDGDILFVPQHQEIVGVIGHVFNPSTFVSEKGMTVGEVVANCGGLTEFADQERVYVMRADGMVQNFLMNQGRLQVKTELLPGDMVLVPRRPLERTFGAQLADVLHYLRDVAEIGLLLSHLGDGTGDFNFSSVSTLNSQNTREGIGYDESILQR